VKVSRLENSNFLGITAIESHRSIVALFDNWLIIGRGIAIEGLGGRGPVRFRLTYVAARGQGRVSFSSN
jgi:hypothetical protein